MDESLVEQIIGSKGPLFGEKIKNIKSINGGCIHDAWKINLISGETFFAKTNSLSSYKILEFEFFGLKALGAYADHSLLIIPKPFAITKLETASILLMPWINMQVNDEKLLGKGLAMMHKVSASTNQGLFGWKRDGFIGSGNQPKGLR